MKRTVFFVLTLVLLAVIVLPMHASAATCPQCGGEMVPVGASAAPQQTCTTGGYLTYYCPDCKLQTRVEYPPLGHDYQSKVLKEATCEEGGQIRHVCSRCQDSYTENTPALGHDYQATVLQVADCLNGGRIQYTCSRCKAGYVQTSAPLGHSFNEEIHEPTCEEDGETVFTCKRCSYSYSEPIEALGHDLEITETAPTCEEDGEHLELCLRCGKEDRTVLPATGHDFEYTTVEATCTSAGKKDGTCKVCGKQTSETIPATGHSFSAWTVVTEPTVFKEGLEQRECAKGDLVETRPLSKKSPVPIILLVSLLGGGSATAGVFISRAARAAKAASSPGMITLQLKHVLSLLSSTAENRQFETFLKKKKFVDLKKPGQVSADPNPEKGKKYQPDLLLIEADSAETLEAGIAAAKEKYGDVNIGVLAGDGLGQPILDSAVKNKDVFAYAYRSYSESRRLIRLIMPLYKPSEASGNYAENATLITGALGLPVLSAILNAYVVGGDIKEAIEKRGMSKAETADLINDIAGLFGLEALASITEALRIGADQSQRAKDNSETEAETESK